MIFFLPTLNDRVYNFVPPCKITQCYSNMRRAHCALKVSTTHSSETFSIKYAKFAEDAKPAALNLSLSLKCAGLNPNCCPQPHP